MATPRIDRLDKNFLINGGLDYWQRNNNLSTGAGEISGYNSVDRFAVTTFNTSGTRQSAQQGGDKPNELTKYSGLLAFTSTASATFDISQKIEGIFARELSGKTCSFGMWYKTDEFSSIRVRILRPTAEDNYASTVTIYDQTIAVTADSTWRQLKIEGGIVMDSSMYLGCQVIVSGVARVNSAGARFFRYAQLQLNIGFQLPAFNLFAGNLVHEERACFRYFENGLFTFLATSASGSGLDSGIRPNYPFKARKRVAPSVSRSNVVLNQSAALSGTPSVVDDGIISTDIDSFTPRARVTVSGFINLSLTFNFAADAEI